MKLIPFCAETAAEVLDSGSADLQGFREMARFAAAVAKEVEESAKSALATEPRGETSVGAVEAGLGFASEQGPGGICGGFGDQVDAAGEFAVVEEDRGEVGFIAEEAVFGAVMETVDEAAHAALEIALDFRKV
jgi:hypothetical protein